MVSVIIPVYNAEKFIAETINSVIFQSFQDWELIIVDDGSTDESAAIIQEFSNQDKRIKYFYQKNAGVSVARNAGISKSKGDLLSFLDADDCWKPNNIQNRLALFDHKVDWVFGSVELINETSEKLNQVIIGNDKDILNSLLLWNGEVITNPSTITIKRKCIKNILFDTDFSTAADQDFVFNLAANFIGKYYDESTVQYRKVDDSMSKNISIMEKDHIGVYKKAVKNKLFKNFFFKQKCFSNLYWILAGSWWKDGGNKIKGLYFIIMALLANPFSISRVFKSLVK